MEAQLNHPHAGGGVQLHLSNHFFVWPENDTSKNGEHNLPKNHHPWRILFYFCEKNDHLFFSVFPCKKKKRRFDLVSCNYPQITVFWKRSRGILFKNIFVLFFLRKRSKLDTFENNQKMITPGIFFILAEILITFFGRLCARHHFMIYCRTCVLSQTIVLSTFH